MQLPYNLTIALFGICPREIKTYSHAKTYTQIFTAALFIIDKNWNQPRCPTTDEWLNKWWYMHILEYNLVI